MKDCLDCLAEGPSEVSLKNMHWPSEASCLLRGQCFLEGPKGPGIGLHRARVFSWALFQVLRPLLKSLCSELRWTQDARRQHAGDSQRKSGIGDGGWGCGRAWSSVQVNTLFF